MHVNESEINSVVESIQAFDSIVGVGDVQGVVDRQSIADPLMDCYTQPPRAMIAAQSRIMTTAPNSP